jgi:hypothetical protein
MSTLSSEQEEGRQGDASGACGTENDERVGWVG